MLAAPWRRHCSACVLCVNSLYTDSKSLTSPIWSWSSFRAFTNESNIYCNTVIMIKLLNFFSNLFRLLLVVRRVILFYLLTENFNIRDPKNLNFIKFWLFIEHFSLLNQNFDRFWRFWPWKTKILLNFITFSPFNDFLIDFFCVIVEFQVKWYFPMRDFWHCARSTLSFTARCWGICWTRTLSPLSLSSDWQSNLSFITSFIGRTTFCCLTRLLCSVSIWSKASYSAPNTNPPKSSKVSL